MNEKRYEVFGKSLTEEGLNNFACFLADNHSVLSKGGIVEEPEDFNQPNKENEDRIIEKWEGPSDIGTKKQT